MGKITTVDQALQTIDDEAAGDALEWLKIEKPRTVEAIEYLIFSQQWSADRMTAYINDTYSETEQRVQHKIKLVTEMMIRQREKG